MRVTPAYATLAVVVTDAGAAAGGTSAPSNVACRILREQLGIVGTGCDITAIPCGRDADPEASLEGQQDTLLDLAASAAAVLGATPNVTKSRLAGCAYAPAVQIGRKKANSSQCSAY